MRGYLIDECIQLDFVGVVDASIHECATHLVGGYINAMCINPIVDELVTISRKLFQERLDEIVSLVVLRELNRRWPDHIYKQGNLNTIK